jgi:chromosome segregation protein
VRTQHDGKRLLFQRARALADATEARSQRSALEQQLGFHRGEWAQSTQTLAEREAAWETVRDEEAELRVAHARAEGALSALDRRLSGTREDVLQAQERTAALNAEEEGNRNAVAEFESARTARRRAGGLFAQRDAITAELRVHDDQLAVASEATTRLESEVRVMRRAADERRESRHRLELQKAEAEASLRNTRERLEAEWGRPFELLAREAQLVEGDPDQLRAELHAVAADIERLGPINMLAVEEYAEESQRLSFLQSQREDLVQARDDLQSAIREINKTARELFHETFAAVRANFQTTFQTLFEGGECDIKLEDEEDPLESPIDITANPRGKRTQRFTCCPEASARSRRWRCSLRFTW